MTDKKVSNNKVRCSKFIRATDRAVKVDLQATLQESTFHQPCQPCVEDNHGLSKETIRWVPKHLTPNHEDRKERLKCKDLQKGPFPLGRAETLY